MNPLRPLLVPFWCDTRMVAEPVVFIGDAGQPVAATLLFPPDSVILVTNAAGNVVFENGTDYEVDHRNAGIVRVEGSRVPLISGRSLVPSDPTTVDERLVMVTYSHAPGLWSGYEPVGDPTRLPRTLTRLRSCAPVTVCVSGDSISEGYDASGFRGVAPHQPPYATLLAEGLELAHGGEVRLHNLAVAGWTAEHGRWQSSDIAAVHPDLVIVAFGMNDACYAEPPEFASGIAEIIQGVQTTCPDAEFLLVSPMLPTPECDWVAIERFAGYRDALLSMTNDRVAVADMTSVWQALLARKHPHDLSGNGTNHPNDFGHRVYAQTLMSVLCSALTP